MIRLTLFLLIPILGGWGAVSLGGGVPAVGGGGTPDVLAAMDFDDGSCIDSQGGSWVAAVTSSGECQGTAIDGSTYSGNVNAANGAVIKDVAAFTEQTSGFVTADFLFEATVNTATAAFNTFKLRTAAEGTSATMRFVPSTPGVIARSPDGQNSATITIVSGTLYYVRLRYDIDLDVTYLALWTDDWGGSTAATGSPVSSDDVLPANVGGWQLEQHSGNNLADLEIDEIRICDGDYGTTPGPCENI